MVEIMPFPGVPAVVVTVLATKTTPSAE